MNNSPQDSEKTYSLKSCFHALQNGPWRLIQLRGASNLESWLSEDDVDFLASKHSVDLLLAEAKNWVMLRWCHFRVICRSERKVELYLYSLDGQEKLILDLWICMQQLDRGMQWISYETASGPVQDLKTGIGRWIPEVEFAVYIHHLVCKKKDLSSTRVQQRLNHYQQLFKQELRDELASEIQQIQDELSIPQAFEDQMLRVLEKQFTLQSAKSYRSSGRLWKKVFLEAPRKNHLVSVMGCDGVGKTSLINYLKSSSPDSVKAFTGKHLYRKSLCYKLMVIFIRPLMFQNREKFDETLAPFAYLRACLKLYIFAIRYRSALLLVDRNLLDFLYLDRKTDQPRFSSLLGLSCLFGLRIPTIHCVMEYDVLVTRKKEMTEQGHSAYDHDMMNQFTSRRPTDYTMFYNGGSLAESHNALKMIVNDMVDLNLNK